MFIKADISHSAYKPFPNVSVIMLIQATRKSFSWPPEDRNLF